MLANRPCQASVVSIGVELGREHWGQGLTIEALAAVVTHCLNELGMVRPESD